MAENVAVEQNPKTAALVALANGLKGENAAWVTNIVDALDEVTVYVSRENIVDVCWFLKTRHQFDMLMDLNGNDLGAEEDPRFEVIYQLFSTKTYQRLRLKVLLSDEDTHVQTVTTVWRT